MKILVADDDPVTLEALTACFKADGFQTLAANNGTEAMNLWHQAKVDLVCLDIMMPEMDGYEVCRRIRATNSQVPVLFLSAKHEEIDVVVGLELGADDFIRKPFGKHELLARVKVALRRGKQKLALPANSFAMLDLEIWPEELRAQRNQRDIDLTPREVSLLQVLHHYQGRPVDRDMFLERCWGIDYANSRTLDTHIANLRKKIETDPANPTIIETVRGVGYRYRGNG
jgi:two-component system, OmpR family, alkaline phosphatase synthesis response regulator PhoP